MSQHSQNTLSIFYNNDILLYSHNTTTKIRKLTLTLHCCLTLDSILVSPASQDLCPLHQKDPVKPCAGFSCHVSLVSFKMELFPQSPTSEDYSPLIFLESSSIWICLVFPYDEIQIMEFWLSNTEVLSGGTQPGFVLFLIIFTLISCQASP